MSHIRKKLKLSHGGTGGRKTQQNISPAASSASITLGDSAVTTHIQQEQSRDSFPSLCPTNSQQSPAARSLWDRAYDALSKEMPDLVKDYDELLAKEQLTSSAPNETTPLMLPASHGLHTLSGCSPRQVRLNTVIHKGLRRMEDNKTKPTYKIGRHEIRLPEHIANAANFLLWVKDWVGSAVKDSPQASLAWSAVCLVLPLFTNPTTAAEANRDGFVYVTSRMRYYIALEPLLCRLGQNARVDEAVISAANDHIVELYQAILEFQLRSVLRFYQGRLKTYVRDIVPSRDWKQTLLDIKTREGAVNGDLGQINALAARQELELLNKTTVETRAAMEDFLFVATQQLAVSNEQLAVLKQQQAAQEASKQEKLLADQRECLQAFYLTQNGSGATYDWYKSRVELRVDGTCRWFLQHRNFQQWLSQESGPLLVSADPGCGKSVLAKYLIEHELAQQSATICYFFFKDQDQNTNRQALCALLHQLFRQKIALIQHAMKPYDEMGANMVESEASLWTILGDAVRDPQAGPIIFVIDALDECDESQLRSLITNLGFLFRDQQLANAKFKVLMTSRPYKQVVGQVYRSLQDNFPRIHIPGEDEFEMISQEINSVIHHRVEQLAKSHRLSDKIKSSLDSKLLAIEHRTYLWVHLVFDYLDMGLYKQTDDGIDAALRTLPKTINQAYDQILNRSQEDETVNDVRKALSIILAARRPLTLSEMNIAMSLDGQGRGRSIYDLDLEQDKPFKTRLRALCGLFINVHHDKVYFLHQTAREFLLQSSPPLTVSSNLRWHHSITIRQAHSVLAEICTFYLDRLNSTHRETFCITDHHGALLRYSARYWAYHCREANLEKSSAVLDLASGLCTLDFTGHSQWASIVSGQFGIHTKSCTNLLFASRLGHTPVIELLLSRGVDTETKDSQGMTALMLAADYGPEELSQLLLNNGASVEAKDYKGWTAFMHAAESGNAVVTRLLLENGANGETRDADGWTALMHATVSGLSGYTVRHKMCGNDGTEIEYGSRKLDDPADDGPEAVLRLLLDNGANIEARGDDGTTALMHAAKHGIEAVTRLLLDNGANVEARGDDGTTALMLAARNGVEAVTQLLVENGANLEAKNSRGRTPLICAIGHEAVTRILLDNGANVEARDDDGWTALICAAESGHEAVLRLLLENGATVEAKNSRGWTALMYGALSGHASVIQMLLDNGANVEVRDADGWTALICAAESGHEAVLRRLLESGANVEAKDNYGWTALMHAAVPGHEAVTRLLLNNGADVEAKDNYGWTALLHAAVPGHEAVTRLLLNNGDDVEAIEARDDNGTTALMHAAIPGHEAVTRLLPNNGGFFAANYNYVEHFFF